MKTSEWILILGLMIAAIPAGAQKGGFVSVGEESLPTKTDAPNVPDAKAADTSLADPKKDDSGGVAVNSAVNVIRRTDRTEVMMRDGEIYYLPSGSRNAAIFAACEDSEKTGKPISMIVNPKTKIIQSVGSSSSGSNKGQVK